VDDRIKIKKEDLKIRKAWPNKDFSPETKIHKVKTDYQRQDSKKIIEETLEQEQLEDSGPDDLSWLP
jgi:hypothetical protein